MSEPLTKEECVRLRARIDLVRADYKAAHQNTRAGELLAIALRTCDALFETVNTLRTALDDTANVAQADSRQRETELRQEIADWGAEVDRWKAHALDNLAAAVALEEERDLALKMSADQQGGLVELRNRLAESERVHRDMMRRGFVTCPYCETTYQGRHDYMPQLECPECRNPHPLNQGGY